MNKKILSIAVIVALTLLFIVEIKLISDGLLDGILPSFVKNNVKDVEETPQPPAVVPDTDAYDNSINNEQTPRNINVTYDNIFAINNFDIIKKNLYNVDSTAYVYDNDIDYNRLLAYNMSVDLKGEAPKILIFHTHSREGFTDSREGNEDDTIVGVGDTLAKILKESYGIPVLHHKGIYDMKDGKNIRDGSYERMEPDIRSILEQNPSIEVMIDLHRDSLPEGRHLITDINGVKTASIMFFNGICRENKNGEPRETEWLINEYLDENMAFSLRMKLLANEMFPGFTRKNYIKPYRYSLHMKPKSLLVEVGSDANTVAEAKNAMVPLAQILVKALT